MTLLEISAISTHTPITAIVIYRNERRHLERCLRALRWCDELIAVDMASSDGSIDIARRLADRVYHVDAYPIAEPARVAAAKLASHDWVLLVDPDEEIPESLAEDMRRALAERPGVGAVSLPMWFYFKGERLTGTVWGTLTYKRRLIHRRRCRLLPLCNRLNEMVEGFEDHRIEHRWLDTDHCSGNHMRHFWSDSYRELAWRHVRRYTHLEAAAMVARGQRFSLRWALTFPLHELNRTLRHFDGWRMGLRGWLLSAIYFVYVLGSTWLTAWYQWRPRRLAADTVGAPATLRPDSATVAAGKRRAAA